MLRKAYTPARLFTESILFLLMGSLMLLHPEKTLVLALDVLRWLLPAGGIINLTEWLLHGRQKRIALVKGVALLAGGLTLMLWPRAMGISISLVFGLWMALNCLCKLIYAIQLQADGERGWLANLLAGIMHGLFAALLLAYPLWSMLPLTLLLGLYSLGYGLFTLGDAVRELLGTDIKGRSVRQRIRIAPPILLTALIPQWLLRMLNDPDEAEETSRWTRRETNDRHAKRDLEIFFHLSKDTAMGMGHVDIALGEQVYAYGCYDASSNRLFGLISDGVLVMAQREPYIAYCLDHEKKKLISFGVSLDQAQRESVRAAAERFMAGSTLWTPPEESPQADFARTTGATFHKLRKGPFQTYNALKTNCVALADILCGASGLDLMNLQGIITPGTYYAFLDRQFLRRNSIVISRTVYK